MEVIGIGVILQTDADTYLLQERDYNTDVNPGRITPFGGGLEDGEDVHECAKRELLEELELTIDTSRLEDLGVFASRNEPDIHIHMFLVKGVEKSKLILHEGKSIVESSLHDALADERVTDFTKEVLKAVLEK